MQINDFTLGQVIDDIDRVISSHGEEIPREYWNEYKDCQYIKVETIYKNQKCAILRSGIVYPSVILVSKAKGGYSIGHGLTCGETVPDYTHVYFMAGNGKMTRNIEEAKIYWLTRDRRYDDNQFLEDKPNGYMIIGTFLKWKAQETIDKQYPLPRKRITKKEREIVYNKFDGHCAYCGKPLTLKEMQVDHIKSHMSNCGKDELSNYYPSCSICNRVKSNSTLEGFRNHIKKCGQIHRKRKKPIMADSDKIAIAYGIDKEDNPIKFYFEKIQADSIDMSKD